MRVVTWGLVKSSSERRDTVWLAIGFDHLVVRDFRGKSGKMSSLTSVRSKVAISSSSKLKDWLIDKLLGPARGGFDATVARARDGAKSGLERSEMISGIIIVIDAGND